MTSLPTDPTAIINQFGPHLAHTGGMRLDTGLVPDRIVKTHCCFCGQQCGIQLKVKNDRVVGFEPWEEFPFNKGKLCPKGVKRYMQNEHPDRLLTALERRAGAGFAPVSYEQAIDRVARELQRVQAEYGRDAVAVLGGASFTNERAYLLGKFARVA